MHLAIMQHVDGSHADRLLTLSEMVPANIMTGDLSVDLQIDWAIEFTYGIFKDAGVTDIELVSVLADVSLCSNLNDFNERYGRLISPYFEKYNVPFVGGF